MWLLNITYVLLLEFVIFHCVLTMYREVGNSTPLHGPSPKSDGQRILLSTLRYATVFINTKSLKIYHTDESIPHPLVLLLLETTQLFFSRPLLYTTTIISFITGKWESWYDSNLTMQVKLELSCTINAFKIYTINSQGLNCSHQSLSFTNSCVQALQRSSSSQK